jgi:hypothetical protein
VSDQRDSIDPDAPPTPEEIAAAEKLRDALTDPKAPHEAADFARAIALGHAPRDLDPAEHRRIVDAGISRGDARVRGRRKKVMRLAYVGGGALAMAAAFALFVGNMTLSKEQAPVAAAPPLAAIEPLVPLRSTQPLFREPFARAGGESARIDRIASARASDLRDNRFARWGVR